MSSILVLGGAGYIGSHTVYELIEAGENVVVVDNLETGFRKAVHPDAKFYQGDIRDRAFIDSVFEKEDIDEPQYLTGAMRGTAYHRIFELLDMELEEYNQETVKKMIDGFVDAGLIDRMGAASVMRKDIIDFTKSDLFRRMKKAYANNQLYREQHFLMGVPACEINSNTTSKETMIIQWIFDFCFLEND